MREDGSEGLCVEVGEPEGATGGSSFGVLGWSHDQVKYVLPVSRDVSGCMRMTSGT